MMYLVIKDTEPVCICGSEDNAILISKKLLSPFNKNIRVIEVLSSKIIVDYANT